MEGFDTIEEIVLPRETKLLRELTGLQFYFFFEDYFISSVEYLHQEGFASK